MGLDVADDGPLLAGTAVVARFVIAHGGHDRALIDASGFQLARQAASHLGASIGGEPRLGRVVRRRHHGPDRGPAASFVLKLDALIEMNLVMQGEILVEACAERARDLQTAVGAVARDLRLGGQALGFALRLGVLGDLQQAGGGPGSRAWEAGRSPGE